MKETTDDTEKKITVKEAPSPSFSVRDLAVTLA
jgi:hypothetical protein